MNMMTTRAAATDAAWWRLLLASLKFFLPNGFFAVAASVALWRR